MALQVPTPPDPGGGGGGTGGSSGGGSPGAVYGLVPAKRPGGRTYGSPAKVAVPDTPLVPIVLSALLR